MCDCIKRHCLRWVLLKRYTTSCRELWFQRLWAIIHSAWCVCSTYIHSTGLSRRVQSTGVFVCCIIKTNYTYHRDCFFLFVLLCVTEIGREWKRMWGRHQTSEHAFGWAKVAHICFMIIFCVAWEVRKTCWCDSFFWFVNHMLQLKPDNGWNIFGIIALVICVHPLTYGRNALHLLNVIWEIMF